jgi:DNA-binding protein HU-beta
MTKAGLVSAIAAEMEKTTKIQARAFLNAFGRVVGKALNKEDNFVFPGIVKLVLVGVPAKPERQVRNPSTGAVMTAPPKKASKKLKARFLKAIKVEVGQLPPPPPKAKRTAPRGRPRALKVEAPSQ